MPDRGSHNRQTADPGYLSGSAIDKARLRWHLDKADALFEAGRDEDARDVLADAVAFLPPLEDAA